MLKFVAAASVLSGVASGFTLEKTTNYEPKLIQAVKTMSADKLTHGGHPLPPHDHHTEEGTNVWFQVRA